MMGDRSAIEWTEATWNPLVGCSRISEGCRHCYAERLVHRGLSPQHRGLTKLVGGEPHWTGEVRLVESALALPLRWKRPRRVFVNSLSDLFHEAVPDEWIDRIFAVMCAARRHVFQVLTKRPARMRAYLTQPGQRNLIPNRWLCESWSDLYGTREDRVEWATQVRAGSAWPLPNVWLGVSAENQETADARIPLLLQTPAAVRFVSAEPLLGPVHVHPWLPHDASDPAERCFRVREPSLDWVIVGGESGPGARPCDLAWIRSLVAQSRTAGMPVFVKQLGAYVVDRNDAGFEGDKSNAWPMDTRTEDLTTTGWQGEPVRVRLRDRKGGDPAEWPADLRVREFPMTNLMPAAPGRPGQILLEPA